MREKEARSLRAMFLDPTHDNNRDPAIIGVVERTTSCRKRGFDKRFDEIRMVDTETKVHLNDGDSDAPMAKNQVSETTSKTPSADNTVLFSPQLLQMYYSRLFPYSFMHSWLSYGSKDTSLFSRREFSFTLDVNGEEVYMRYQSFSSADELQQRILNRRPTKIDIGAVFSADPSQKNTLSESRFQPVQREFVLDVDLTDYDDIRKCGCTGAMICPKCWTFMQMAVKVMDEGLRKDFGFSHVAWFYSGRRGVHAWVCDESARLLSDEGRSAVATYFEVMCQGILERTSMRISSLLTSALLLIIGRLGIRSEQGCSLTLSFAPDAPTRVCHVGAIVRQACASGERSWSVGISKSMGHVTR